LLSYILRLKVLNLKSGRRQSKTISDKEHKGNSKLLGLTHEGGTVKFGGNQTGKIIGTGTIGNCLISINNVWLVDELRHNL